MAQEKYASVQRPDSPEVLNHRGLHHYLAGHYLAALDYFTHSLELDPHQADTLNNRGLTYHALGRYLEAYTDSRVSLPR